MASTTLSFSRRQRDQEARSASARALPQPTRRPARHDPSLRALAALGAHTHPAGMFVVSEAEAAAIRATFEQRGEFAAAVELRRLFPGVTDTAQARAFARTIAGWKPLPVRSRQWTRRDPRRAR